MDLTLLSMPFLLCGVERQFRYFLMYLSTRPTAAALQDVLPRITRDNKPMFGHKRRDKRTPLSRAMDYAYDTAA